MQAVTSADTHILRAMLGRWKTSRLTEDEFYPYQQARIRYWYQSLRLSART